MALAAETDGPTKCVTKLKDKWKVLMYICKYAKQGIRHQSVIAQELQFISNLELLDQMPIGEN